PAEAHSERGQKGDDVGRLGRYFLLQDYLAGIVDNAHRRFLHRHIKTSEMHHLIAPSSMIEVARPQSAIVRERGRALIIQAEPQPPRYTIFTSPFADARVTKVVRIFGKVLSVVRR